MADIQKMLELNSRLEKGNDSVKVRQSQAPQHHDLDMLIENLDQQVYGPPSEAPVFMEDGRKKYDPTEEMKRLKEIEESGGHREINLEGKNIPKNILESIINNPLDLPVIDPQMDELERKLTENMTGIKKAANIVSKIDKQEQEARQKLNEQLTPKYNSSFDYETLKTLIESTIDKKIGELKQSLNESISRPNAPTAKLMSFKDKFLFVDSDDNVFECVMQYKGKKKRNS